MLIECLKIVEKLNKICKMEFFKSKILWVIEICLVREYEDFVCVVMFMMLMVLLFKILCNVY